METDIIKTSIEKNDFKIITEYSLNFGLIHNFSKNQDLIFQTCITSNNFDLLDWFLDNIDFKMDLGTFRKQYEHLIYNILTKFIWFDLLPQFQKMFLKCSKNIIFHEQRHGILFYLLDNPTKMEKFIDPFLKSLEQLMGNIDFQLRAKKKSIMQTNLFRFLDVHTKLNKINHKWFGKIITYMKILDVYKCETVSVYVKNMFSDAIKSHNYENFNFLLDLIDDYSLMDFDFDNYSIITMLLNHFDPEFFNKIINVFQNDYDENIFENKNILDKMKQNVYSLKWLLENKIELFYDENGIITQDNLDLYKLIKIIIAENSLSKFKTLVELLQTISDNQNQIKINSDDYELCIINCPEFNSFFIIRITCSGQIERLLLEKTNSLTTYLFAKYFTKYRMFGITNTIYNDLLRFYGRISIDTHLSNILINMGNVFNYTVELKKKVVGTQKLIIFKDTHEIKINSINISDLIDCIDDKCPICYNYSILYNVHAYQSNHKFKHYFCKECIYDLFNSRIHKHLDVYNIKCPLCTVSFKCRLDDKCKYVFTIIPI
jgi:hypothetical protein